MSREEKSFPLQQAGEGFSFLAPSHEIFFALYAFFAVKIFSG